MKKFISLLLTVVMVISMIIVPATAVEGNAGVYFHGANVNPDELGSSWFNYSYAHISGEDDETIDYIKRVNESGAEHYGGFNYTQVFDFKVTDYGEGSDHFTDFTFSNDITNYHYGYSFTHKAFVVYDMYMPGFDPNSGHYMLAKMSYDLKLDTWYEMTIRFVDKTITIYLNGVEMLVADLTYLYNDVMGEDPVTGTIGSWDWTAREKPEVLDKDMLFFTPVDVDMYLDNMAFYSGDYDISTGTATTTYCSDSDFTNMSLADDANFCDFSFSKNFVYDPNGGTEKVSYNRAEAAAHSHAWALNTEKSSTAHCLVAGYDLYECTNGCGASEQRNYVAPLGHLPGYIDTVVIAADAENSGVEKRICTRDNCGLTYTTITNLTDANNGALHGYTDGGTSIYNGYMGVGSKQMMALEGGIAVEFDVMPLAQLKDFSEIMVSLGGNEYEYSVGYSYELQKYVIKLNDEIVAESDKAFNNYEWQKWAIVHNDLEILFYVDSELLLSADVPEDIYTLVRVDEEGEISEKTLEDCYQWVLYAPATELLVDNVVVADPDFDFETRAGVIYANLDFNGGKVTVDSNGFIYDPEVGSPAFHTISYDKTSGAGYKIEAYGRPSAAVTEIHEDRAIKIDCDYENNSMNAYSMLWTPDEGQTGTNLNDVFAENTDLEFTYDFYAYDWCTDETILKKTEEVTTTDENGNEVVETIDRYASAYLGGHINSDGVGTSGSNNGNAFAGYDFIKQQVVIGNISTQAGGYYGENTQYADYPVEKNTWHNMSIRYKYDPTNTDFEDGAYIVSVYMDGNEVLTRAYGYWELDVEYYIFYPNFVKAYLDNVTLKLNGVTYTDGFDFTNAYDEKTAGMDFYVDNANGSSGYSIVPGGVPTHVYEETIFPASCLTDGYTTYACSCGESTYTLNNLPATGHEYDDGVVTVEPTGSTKGEMTYTCIHCGDTYTEEIATLFTYGDVDDSGAIDNTDLSLFKRYGKGAKPAFNELAADVNVSGSADNTDMTILIRFLKGGKIVLGA